MANPSSDKDLQPFFGLTADQVDSALISMGFPKFRGRQVRDWVYARGVLDPRQMTDLGKLDRERIAERFSFGTAQTAADQLSSDGTRKLLLRWDDVAVAETVLIPDADRQTACVSSQVGCPVGCRFCASGVGGVKGNLTADRIVEQVVAFNRFLVPQASRVNHVVLMGMGEPLANYSAVLQAIRVLHDPGCLNIGARKITLSTVGVPERIRQLAHEQIPINLALSLHAPNEKLRRQLIPWAEHFAIGQILDACRYYFDKTGREITLEYILLAGINDRPEHARELALLCQQIRCNVNLIRYNEVAGLPFARPESADVMRFQSVLRNNRVNAHVRKSRGRDIDAACGQLRRKADAPPAPGELGPAAPLPPVEPTIRGV